MRSSNFRKLVSANPNNELFRFSLGQALMEENEEEEALRNFDYCFEKKPDWMMAAILKGKCLLALNRNDEAETILKQGLQLAIDQKHEAPEAEIRKILAGL